MKSKIFLKDEIALQAPNGKDFCFPVVIIDVNGKKNHAAFTWGMIQQAEKKYKQIKREGMADELFQDKNR